MSYIPSATYWEDSPMIGFVHWASDIVNDWMDSEVRGGQAFTKVISHWSAGALAERIAVELAEALGLDMEAWSTEMELAGDGDSPETYGDVNARWAGPIAEALAKVGRNPNGDLDSHPTSHPTNEEGATRDG